MARMGRVLAGLTAAAWGVTALAARLDRANIPRPRITPPEASPEPTAVATQSASSPSLSPPPAAAGSPVDTSVSPATGSSVPSPPAIVTPVVDARAHRSDTGGAPGGGRGRVSIILPARDEAAAIGAAVRSHLRQTHTDLELIVVDDGSTDDTAAVAERAAAGDPRFRIVPAGPLPEGWIGKSWACHRGAQEATGGWLLFSDADVVHEPETLAACLRLADDAGRAGVTLAPRILMGSIAERIVLPAAAFIILAVMAPGPLARSPRSRVTMAAGAYLLVRRDVYDRIGGHEAIHGHMVDDLALARAVKGGGDLLIPADGTDVIRLHMYDGVRAMWRGWRKNAAFASPRGRTRGLAPAVMLGVLALTPAVAAARGLTRRDGRLLALGAAGLGAQAWAQRLSAPITATPGRYALTFPLGVLFMALVSARGAIDRLTGRGPVWRGRRYPQSGAPHR